MDSMLLASILNKVISKRKKKHAKLYINVRLARVYLPHKRVRTTSLYKINLRKGGGLVLLPDSKIIEHTPLSILLYIISNGISRPYCLAISHAGLLLFPQDLILGKFGSVVQPFSGTI